MLSTPAIGIHDLTFATTHYRLDHTVLADQLGVSVAKFHKGLGMESMSMPAADEDIVTMAATAAQQIITRHGADRIRTILFATETGVDQSKAAGLYVHGLLDLPANCRVVELKQACYGGTGALQMAIALVARNPDEQVLVLASDIAHYELDSAAEATQGAAAVAMLVSADPAVLRLDPRTGIHSDDIMDFWRPNDRTEPVVDGRLSMQAYLHATERAWIDYSGRDQHNLTDFAAFCYHQPFTKMAHKAHHHLLDTNGLNTDGIDAALTDSSAYNRLIGNSYTASLYIGLISLLDHRDDLTDQHIGLLSYGSGSVAEFFTATPVPGYHEHLRTADHQATINRREPLDYRHYRALHERMSTLDGGDRQFDVDTHGPCRLAAVIDRKRIYEKVPPDSHSPRATA